MRRIALLTTAMLAAWPCVAAPVLVPTNMPGVMSIAGPPPGFDAVHASAQALRDYGLPPRPLPLYRRAYANWVRVVQSLGERIVPVLRMTDHVAGPALHVQAPGLPGTLYAKNWSGLVIVNGVGGFGAGSIANAAGTFVVPIASSPFGTCQSGLHEASWAGIDGWQSNAPDVLQAGTESDVSCVNGNNYTSYYAWFEWYPNNQIGISNLPVVPGDVINVFVGASSSTSGFLLVQNGTTNHYVSMNISAPGGTHLVGSSAEWIVERPSINKNITTLMNYVTTWMTSTGAAIGNSWFDYATPPPGNTPYNVIMLDNNGGTISTPTDLYGSGLVLNDSGSAK